jgi:hypothetical protein
MEPGANVPSWRTGVVESSVRVSDGCIDDLRWETMDGVRPIHYVEFRVRTPRSVLGKENAKIGRRRWDEEPKTDEKENGLELPALPVLAIENEQGLTRSGILNRMKTVSVEGEVRKQRF